MRAATYNDVFAFLWRSMLTMTCFFDCFRIRRNHIRQRSNLTPDSSLFNNNGEIALESSVSSLFTAEGKEECTIEKSKNLIQQVDRSDIDEELLLEAKFLKACGTLPETPAEIRKAVFFTENLEKSDTKGSCSVLKSSAETPDEIQQAQAEMHPENSERTDFSVLESSPETPEEIQTTETSAESSDKSHAHRPRTVLRSSPYPTPRKLTDDMQTPGTVFATNMKSFAQGNVRIRSQYVYTVLNPIENLNHQQELKADKSARHESPDHEEEYLSEQESITPCSRISSTSIVDSSEKENIGSVSLSSWLKPPLANNNATHHNLGAVSCRKLNIGRTPGDKPIIGLFTTHWNEQEEASHASPKWWDGNGIPNSTSKYKEDQKVRWHATPFEERLERALSEETSVPLRKPIEGMPIVFEETEEQLDTENCNSVLSF